MGYSCCLCLIICFRVPVLNSAPHTAPGAALRGWSHVKGSDFLSGCGAHQGKPKIPQILGDPSSALEELQKTE